jgi:hypothetical protein
MKADTGSFIIYKTKGEIAEFRIYSFEESDHAAMQIQVSNDGENFETIKANISHYNQSGTNYYGYQYPVLYQQQVDAGYRYLKLVFERKVELARVEVCYQ